MDFLINIYHGIKIIRLHTLGEESKLSKFLHIAKQNNNLRKYCFIAKEKIQGLIITERIEFIVPLTYMVMLLMAYYGPNADILGNVKLKMWHFQTPITNINDFVITLGFMLAIDFFSFIVA